MSSSTQVATKLALPALAALAACLAGLIAWELEPQPEPGPAASPATAPAARPGIPAPLPDTSSWATVALSRPLFDQARRPSPTNAVAARPGLPRLAGVLVSGTERTAILVPPDSRAAVTAHEGAQVGAFTVQAIAAGTVTLLGPDGVLVMRPTFDGSPPALPPAVPVAVPPSIDED